MLTRAGFELALSGCRSAALPVELLSAQRLEVSFYLTQVDEMLSRQLNAYPQEDVQCFNSISESSSEMYLNMFMYGY